MSERESTLRTTLVTYFPMAIAVLSLVTSIFNGYVNTRFLDFTERNVGRIEYLRTCRDILDAYFQIKARAGALARTGEGAGADRVAEFAAQEAVAKFGALGTHLANLRNEDIRARYTELFRELERIVQAAKDMSRTDLAKAFQPADRIFGELNADCVARAKEMRS
jgi:hypothetical protein